MTLRTDWDQLLGAARGGDVQALGRLVEVAGEDLRTIASAVLGPSTRQRLRLHPEDVFSDAIVAAMREIGRLRATSYLGFRHWFATIARSTAIDPIDWVEMISIDETRNYVQRVTENLYVYRRKLGSRSWFAQMEREFQQKSR